MVGVVAECLSGGTAERRTCVGECLALWALTSAITRYHRALRFVDMWPSIFRAVLRVRTCLGSGLKLVPASDGCSSSQTGTGQTGTGGEDQAQAVSKRKEGGILPIGGCRLLAVAFRLVAFSRAAAERSAVGRWPATRPRCWPIAGCCSWSVGPFRRRRRRRGFAIRRR